MLFDMFDLTPEQRVMLDYAVRRCVPLYLVTPSSIAGSMFARRLNTLRPRDFKVQDIVQREDDDTMHLHGCWYFEATATLSAPCDVPLTGSTVVVY